jgi:starvation-inducible DNA-binding protein
MARSGASSTSRRLPTFPTRQETITMYPSPSPLPEKSRAAVAEALEAVLADGLDLHAQIKVAHWNVKGPHFPALHPLFETFATALSVQTDAVAERAVTLGAVVRGTVRHVAARSRLPEYAQETTRGLEHVRLLSERFERFLAGVRHARGIAQAQGDDDTVDLLTTLVEEFEKNAWFLRATLAE